MKRQVGERLVLEFSLQFLVLQGLFEELMLLVWLDAFAQKVTRASVFNRTITMLDGIIVLLTPFRQVMLAPTRVDVDSLEPGLLRWLRSNGIP